MYLSNTETLDILFTFVSFKLIETLHHWRWWWHGIEHWRLSRSSHIPVVMMVMVMHIGI